MSNQLRLRRVYTSSSMADRKARHHGRTGRTPGGGVRIGPVQINIDIGRAAGVGFSDRLPWTSARVFALAAGAVAFGFVVGIMLVG